MSKTKSRLKSLFLINTLALGSMYAINRLISSSAILKNILKPQTGHYYQWKLGTIYYRKSGKGTPILLIHDLNPFSSGYEWNQIEEKLQKDHTVYTIDLLGCGRSDKPGITYTNYLYVQLLSDFIKNVIGEPADVAATGLSSSFVVMAAYNSTDLINKILMINPCSLKKLDQIPDQKSKALKTLISIPIIGTSIYHLEASRQNIEYVITEKYMYNPFHIQQKYIDAYYEAAHYGNGNGKFLLSSLDGCYLNIDIRKALSSIENKIGIIYGDKLNNEKEICEGYKKIQPSISTQSVSRTKLLPQLESPEELLNTLYNFL